MLKISKSGAELSGEMTLENKYYEYGKYKIEARYQVGLLELDARLDEPSLKLRAEVSDTAGKGILGGFGFGHGAGGLGSVYRPSVLGLMLNRPEERIILVLVPGEPIICGISAATATAKDGAKESRVMLND